ncbi:hypothetical protein MIR68_003263 [Amoeboaphelidium protococcarum]|nr:hypothetical protein MIR68_003263 [Amoeboaphelidium protococcarum]
MLFLGYQSSGKNYSNHNQSERVKVEEQKLRQCERELEQIFGALLSGEVDGSTLQCTTEQLLQYVECSFSLHGSYLSKSAQQQDKLYYSTDSSVRKPTALSKLRRSLVRQTAATQSPTIQPISTKTQDADNSVLQNGQLSLLKLESQLQQQQQQQQQQKVQAHADVSVVESHVTLSQSIERLSTIAGDVNVDRVEEFSMQSDITVLDTRDNQQFQHDKKSVEHGSIQQEVVNISVESDLNAVITLDQDNVSMNATNDVESKVLDAVSSDINLVKVDSLSAQVLTQNESESINYSNLQTEEGTDTSGQQMVFDLKTQRWVGNEDELDIFDQMDEEDDNVVDIIDNDILLQSSRQNYTSSAKQETRKLSEVLLKDIELGSLEDLEIEDGEVDDHDIITSKPVVVKIGIGNELDDLDIITNSFDDVNDIDDDDMAVTRQSIHSDSNSQQQQQQQSRTARDSDTQTLRSIKSLAPSIQSNSLEPDLSYFEVPARLEEWETQHNEWVQSLKGENFSFEDAFEASTSQTRKPN